MCVNNLALSQDHKYRITIKEKNRRRRRRKKTHIHTALKIRIQPTANIRHVYLLTCRDTRMFECRDKYITII